MMNKFSPLNMPLLAIIAIIVGGALLLWLVLHYAFGVTSGLLQPTPPVY